jgi:acyl carrier protein
MKIQTTYTSLRHTADSIINIVVKMSGVDKEEVSISSAVNDDLGIDGDDWTDLQMALQEKEGLSLEGLKFYDYFMDEGQISDPSGFVIGLIQFVWYLLTFKWLKMHFSDFYKPLGPPKEKLTIGDLITSKYEGRFVKRSERKFILL